MKHVVVCGLGRFGLRVVERLRDRGGRVTVVTDAETRPDRAARAKSLGAHVIDGDFRLAEVRAAAEITTACAVVLASGNDESNLETALDIRAEAPSVRVLMRLASDHLARRLEEDFGITAVVSPSTLAAPRFVEAALEPMPAADPAPVPPRPQRPRRLRFRRIAWLPLLLFGLFGGGIVLFHRVLHLSWIDAAYFTATILTTVGFGDFNLQYESAPIKLFGIVLMFGGVTLIAMLSSILTNYVVSGAAARAQTEWRIRRLRGHIIVCGLGSVGFAIALDLFERGIPVVVIDATPDDDAARELARRRVLVLHGDARRGETLRIGGLERAQAVIAAVSSDPINLEIGLAARTGALEQRPDRPLRLVLRCFDPDLVRRVHGASSDYTLLSSAEVAAPLVASRALGDEPVSSLAALPSAG
jgi:voltage-gated potassium channel Kch